VKDSPQSHGEHRERGFRFSGDTEKQKCSAQKSETSTVEAGDPEEAITAYRYLLIGDKFPLSSLYLRGESGVSIA
jgi:hypothetical protein